MAHEFKIKYFLLAFSFLFTSCNENALHEERLDVRTHIPAIGMSFDYSKEFFDDPVYVEADTIYLYRKNSTHAGAAPVIITFKPNGYIAESGGWISDSVGNLTTKSSLNSICSNSKWNSVILKHCEVSSSPSPHARFFIADNWPDPNYKYGMLHKGAIFYTNKLELPGVFITAHPEDLNEDFLYTKSKEEMEDNIRKLYINERQSSVIQEFNKIIQSIKFERNSELNTSSIK